MYCVVGMEASRTDGAQRGDRGVKESLHVPQGREHVGPQGGLSSWVVSRGLRKGYVVGEK